MPDPIRLALVITELEPGGAERCLVHLATRLDRQEFSPVVYSLAPRPEPARDQLVRQLAESGVPVHFLGLTRWAQYLSGVKRLTALLQEQRAQVVQAFLFHANVLGTRAAKRAGVPQINTGIRVADPRRWRTTMERWATSAADWHVCVSQSVADFCEKRGYPRQKLVVIPNGVDVGRWKNSKPADLTEFGIPSGRRAITYVGRLDRQKGLDALLAAAGALFREVSDCDLLLVGEGPDREQLSRTVARTGFSARVHFTGSQSDVPGILAASQLLVLPSRWEGMPNVVLEAMAAGLPVVATRAEGVVELLGESAPEQTTPVGDPQAFIHRVRSLLQDPSHAKQLGIQNQSRAETMYGIDTMIERYSDFYRRSASC